MQVSEVKFAPGWKHSAAPTGRVERPAPAARPPALRDPMNVQARLDLAMRLADTEPERAIAHLRHCLAIAHDFRPAREALHSLLMRQRPGLMEFAQINIEVTNKCSNKCYFCPRDEHTRDQGVMSHEDFVFAIDRITEGAGEYVRRVDVQSFGESVLDKGLPRKIRHLASAWPHAYITLFSTLAMPLKDEYLMQILTSGLDEFVISLYAITPEDFKVIYGYDGYENMQKSLSTLAYYNQLLGSPVRLVAKLPHERMYSEKGLTGWKEKRVALIEVCEPNGFTFVESEFSNFGGGRDYNEPTRSICSIVQPGKRGMVVAWNLDVTPCCIDFNSTMLLGNLRDASVQEIFTGPAYRDFVRAHLESQLDAYPVCAKCDLRWDLEASGREAQVDH
jgi:MoaA/NifB/PqqE/SkfB family radical SAM enzyme